MMKKFNINPDQLLALMLHFGGADLYDIFESPLEEKARIPAMEENHGEDVCASLCCSHRLLHSKTEHRVSKI